MLDFGRDPLRFLNVLAAHGPISFSTLGPMPILMLSSPELIEETLLGRYRECIKDRGTRELMPLIGQGLVTSEGELWKRQRKLASPALSPKNIAGYASVMVDCSDAMIERFRNGETRDIHADMMALTLEIVGKTLLGFDARSQAERISHVLETSMVYFDRQLRSWHGVLPHWVPTRDRRAFAQAVREINTIVQSIVQRCRSADQEADHLLARLVRARDEHGHSMSDAQLRDEAVTMLLAGHETTAIALSCAIYQLAKHPEATARLREELATHVGSRPLTMSDLPQLRWLDALVRESLRLYPPAWLIGREVTQPFDLGGYSLQVGDQLLISPYKTQRDPQHFADPERFKPERWLDGLAKRLPRFAYFPFGGGNRVCIGNHFATMQVQLVLGTLIQRLDLTLAPGFELELSPNVTLRPKNGVHVQVRRLLEARPRPAMQAAAVHLS